MTDNMHELIQHSAADGTLILQKVRGDLSGRWDPENDSDAAAGRERDMWCYVPRSGCPHPKECQVVMVLRDRACRDSAEELMKELKLDELAEEKHFLLLFPNPAEGGWNFDRDPGRENDVDYLIRCFGILKGSELGVSGFNGMIFYIAASPAASALLMTMAATRPINVPAMMISAFPEGYEIPADALNVETAAFVCGNGKAAEYLQAANGSSGAEPEEAGVLLSYGRNPNVRLLTTNRILSADTVRIAWERLFSETRRWQNDTYGCYQKRTNFTERGFIPHVKDTSLGCNGGHPQTWYEYVPPQLRGSEEKVPLLFYFHGGGCVPLYGAEQSDWHEVADRENFIVVYPEASQRNMWNAWDDREDLQYSDMDFLTALIGHMKETYPIDESRIYVSGFSMGGMMSNAVACFMPGVIAAAAPCNAFHEGYFSSFRTLTSRMGKGYDPAVTAGETEPTNVKKTADANKAAFDYRMPVIQTAGLIDGRWPITEAGDSRLLCFDYWRRYNNIHIEPFEQDPNSLSGVKADLTFYDGDDSRFLHHCWFTSDEGHASLYELFLAKRCPHALDIRTTGYLWKFLSKFRRNPDGTLGINE